MAEKEYIDRDAVLDLLTNRDVVINPNDEVANIREDVECLPAADVRPVVLCRDCVHYEMGVCLKIYDDGEANKDAWQERKPDDFCSYGEKREES